MVTKDKNVETWMTVGAPENPPPLVHLKNGQNPPEMPEVLANFPSFLGSGR